MVFLVKKIVCFIKTMTPTAAKVVKIAKKMASILLYMGDANRSWDFRLARHIDVGMSTKLDLTLDVFNLLNRANVDEVSTVYAAPVFVGDVAKHYKDGTVAPNPGFGAPRVVLNQRQLQFALKYSF
jgi:hypothetical protein